MPRPSPALLVLLLLAAAAPLAAQQRFSDDSDARWLENCRSGWNGDDDRGRYCEIRNVVPTISGRSLSIDGRQNGSIRVVSTDGDAVRVTARIQTNGASDAEAASLAKEITIDSRGDVVRASGPSMSGWNNHRGWSVSYVVQVPRRFDLNLEAENGSLGVSGVNGKLDLRTRNGSVTLDDVGGDVHARTQNGSLRVQLAGAKWDGAGLDAETQNGSVRLAVPEQYSARLETGTVNGRINTEFPVTVRGRIGRQLSLALGSGGAPVRAMTTNGSVTLSHR